MVGRPHRNSPGDTLSGRAEVGQSAPRGIRTDPNAFSEEAMRRYRRNALILAGIVALLILALMGWAINGVRSPSSY